MKGLIRQSIRFGAVGLVNTAVGLTAIYATLFFFHTGPAIANSIGYAIGLTVSFVLNRIWTFNSNRPIIRVLPKYLLVAAISYLMNLGAVMATFSYVSANPYLAQLPGMVTYTLFMFFGCRWFVFTPGYSA
jgi:putative flippase GtrA